MLYPITIPRPSSPENVVGFIDTQGHVVVQPSYAVGSFFFEGKSSVVDSTGKSGFINYTAN